MRIPIPSPDCVPLSECKPGRLYKLRCRNLSYGVFNGRSDQWAGFIGIREKFSSRYLFTEYHHETGSPYGTVFGVKDSGFDLPGGIKLADDGPTVDHTTNRPINFDKPTDEGGRGWVFTDTDEASEAIMPTSLGNPELFEWLDAQEKILDPRS